VLILILLHFSPYFDLNIELKFLYLPINQKNRDFYLDRGMSEGLGVHQTKVY